VCVCLCVLCVSCACVSVRCVCLRYDIVSRVHLGVCVCVVRCWVCRICLCVCALGGGSGFVVLYCGRWMSCVVWLCAVMCVLYFERYVPVLKTLLFYPHSDNMTMYVSLTYDSISDETCWLTRTDMKQF